MWTIESWDKNIAESDLLADLLTLLIVRAGIAIMRDRWCLAGFNQMKALALVLGMLLIYYLESSNSPKFHRLRLEQIS